MPATMCRGTEPAKSVRACLGHFRFCRCQYHHMHHAISAQTSQGAKNITSLPRQPSEATGAYRSVLKRAGRFDAVRVRARDAHRRCVDVERIGDPLNAYVAAKVRRLFSLL